MVDPQEIRTLEVLAQEADANLDRMLRSQTEVERLTSRRNRLADEIISIMNDPACNQAPTSAEEERHNKECADLLSSEYLMYDRAVLTAQAFEKIEDTDAFADLDPLFKVQ